jgi:DNA-binding transcriptional LysR family regulator
MTPHVSLEQWQALVAVVDAGGYARAAETLHKSQSSVSYAVQQLESQLGVKAFEIKGRKAELTPTGQLLYRRARILLDEAGSVEKAAKSLSAGWEPQIRLAVEVVYPYWLLLKSLDRFGAEAPNTQIELYESVLAGTAEALVNRTVELAIGPQIPQGFEGEVLLRMRAILVAHPEHALHKLGRPVTLRDLRAHRHIVVRETDARRPRKLAVEAAQRWTVSNLSTSIMAVGMGMGYTWIPEDKVRGELHSGALKELPVRERGAMEGALYLMYADRDDAGPGVRRLADIIREDTAAECARAKP